MLLNTCNVSAVIGVCCSCRAADNDHVANVAKVWSSRAEMREADLLHVSVTP